MENHDHGLVDMIDSVEQLATTSFQLQKLYLLRKLYETLTKWLNKAILMFLIFIFVFVVNIGLALWIGDLLGKSYLGFFVIAGFYGLVAIIFNYFLQSRLDTFIGKSLKNI